MQNVRVMGEAMAFVWKGCIRHTMSQWEEFLTMELGTSIVIDNKFHQERFKQKEKPGYFVVVSK